MAMFNSHVKLLGGTPKSVDGVPPLTEAMISYFQTFCALNMAVLLERLFSRVSSKRLSGVRFFTILTYQYVNGCPGVFLLRGRQLLQDAYFSLLLQASVLLPTPWKSNLRVNQKPFAVLQRCRHMEKKHATCQPYPRFTLYARHHILRTTLPTPSLTL